MFLSSIVGQDVCQIPPEPEKFSVFSNSVYTMEQQKQQQQQQQQREKQQLPSQDFGLFVALIKTLQTTIENLNLRLETFEREKSQRKKIV